VESSGTHTIAHAAERFVGERLGEIADIRKVRPYGGSHWGELGNAGEFVRLGNRLFEWVSVGVSILVCVGQSRTASLSSSAAETRAKPAGKQPNGERGSVGTYSVSRKCGFCHSSRPGTSGISS
jgi:uncharacterized membrane protein